jgi:hypothetical protein
MATLMFELLSLELSSARTFVYTEAGRNTILELAKKTAHLANSLTKADIEDWHYYYSARLLYAEIGKGWFLSLSYAIHYCVFLLTYYAPLGSFHSLLIRLFR